MRYCVKLLTHIQEGMTEIEDQTLDQLAEKWTNWAFSVKVHEGKEPEFVKCFDRLIRSEAKDLVPETTWRFSRYKKLLYVVEGDMIGGKVTSFLALAKTKEDVYNYDGGVLMEIQTDPEAKIVAHYIEKTKEYVLPTGYDLRVTKRVSQNHLICRLSKVA